MVDFSTYHSTLILLLFSTPFVFLSPHIYTFVVTSQPPQLVHPNVPTEVSTYLHYSRIYSQYLQYAVPVCIGKYNTACAS